MMHDSGEADRLQKLTLVLPVGILYGVATVRIPLPGCCSALCDRVGVEMCPTALHACAASRCIRRG